MDLCCEVCGKRLGETTAAKAGASGILCETCAKTQGKTKSPIQKPDAGLTKDREARDTLCALLDRLRELGVQV